ncbi:GNAT family N-acetyltransferase [Robbsia sp. Bb-Pol-6]|uniref:GNAT family N-acetyltransferase n=1 Tax=Robbsia betulipollinis TaxID=2981849 RepID=A0ABT3ZPU7_9BURK|nr:GNAT family N-acetyltransferase [Robbsia betulipollinis]MCY0388573.1 GNAT family N-acetyltransferase [Robbsia betulipollinis]
MTDAIAYPAAAVIRPARADDVTAIHALIGELADFEQLREMLVASAADLALALFGPQPAIEARVATVDDEVIAYALFFTNFSSFLGRRGLYLEDLYVRPAHRGTRIGKRLLADLAALALARGCARFEWCVLDWNQSAIAFYESLGATVLKEWRIVRVTGTALETLAAS